MQNLQIRPQETPIGAVRNALHVWRQRKRWSMETLAAEIVEHYYTSGFDGVWLVEFQQPLPGCDAARVMKTNAERLARWLDDQTKDSTLLPFNLLPVLLSVMPADLRLQCAVELLLPVGLDVSLRAGEAVQVSHACVLAGLAKEAGEGVAAFALLAERMGPHELKQALVELEESSQAHLHAVSHIRALLGQGL